MKEESIIHGQLNKSLLSYAPPVYCYLIDKRKLDAEENHLHELALTAMKVANDPHLLPFPL